MYTIYKAKSVCGKICSSNGNITSAVQSTTKHIYNDRLVVVNAGLRN